MNEQLICSVCKKNLEDLQVGESFFTMILAETKVISKDNRKKRYTSNGNQQWIMCRECAIPPTGH